MHHPPLPPRHCPYGGPACAVTCHRTEEKHNNLSPLRGSLGQWCHLCPSVHPSGTKASWVGGDSRVLAGPGGSGAIWEGKGSCGVRGARSVTRGVMRGDLSGGHCHSWGVPLHLGRVPGSSPHRVLGVTLGMAQGSPGSHQGVTRRSQQSPGVSLGWDGGIKGMLLLCYQGVTRVSLWVQEVFRCVTR